MKKVTIDDLIKQIELFEQEVFTEEQKRVFKMAYKIGLKDGKEQGKREMLDIINE